ncbi:hypothetical protein CHS0354_031852, partial [Potamilus streckersoni]
CYATTNVAEWEKKRILGVAEECNVEGPKGDIVIVVGDFSAKVGKRTLWHT